MIERLVFIATLFFFLSIGMNAFIMVGSDLMNPDGTRLNLLNTSSSPVSPNQVIGEGKNVAYDSNAALGASTDAPGSAEAIQAFTYNGQFPPGSLGLDWILNFAFAIELIGLRLAAIYPFLAPIILVPVAIAFALKAFFFMYWGMAGIRAFLGRFL